MNEYIFSGWVEKDEIMKPIYLGLFTNPYLFTKGSPTQPIRAGIVKKKQKNKW